MPLQVVRRVVHSVVWVAGDCVEACQFDAIHMNPETGLPEVDEEKCTACGACSKACPRKIIEIRPKGKNNRRVVVMCVNKDKGAVANKACTRLVVLVVESV